MKVALPSPSKGPPARKTPAPSRVGEANFEAVLGSRLGVVPTLSPRKTSTQLPAAPATLPPAIAALGGKGADTPRPMALAQPTVERTLPRRSSTEGVTKSAPKAHSNEVEEALMVARAPQAALRPLPLFVTNAPVLQRQATPSNKTATTPALQSSRLESAQLSVRAAVAKHQLTKLPQHATPTEKTAPRQPKAERGETVENEQAPRAKSETASPANAMAPPHFAEALQVETSTVRAAAPLAPLAPMMLEDSSLHVMLLPTMARMVLDTGKEDGGRLTVQLKVHDGVTELRASGPGAAMLEARQGELRVALAQEGLALGHFDLTQGNRQQHDERPAPDESAPTRRTPSSSSATTADDGRFHVKA